MSKVTIFDVAKKAGVSTSTVSRVINNRVSKPATRRKVLDAIKELDFTPNQSARNLGSINSNKRIAIILPSKGCFAYYEILQGIREIIDLYLYDFGVLEYTNEQDYREICQSILKSSEYLGIIQISPLQEISDRKVVSVFDNDFSIDCKLESKLTNKQVFLNMQDHLKEIFKDKILKKTKVVENEEASDIALVDTIENGAELINAGYQKPILVLEDAKQVSKLLPIKCVQLDFYSLGAVLARKIIKAISEEETQQITIKM